MPKSLRRETVRSMLRGAALCSALALAIPAHASGPASGPVSGGHCSFGDMRACRDCRALSEAVKGVKPFAGRYEDDIKWTPLFGAFLKNCQSLGRRLLAEGADPNRGGRHGSMLITVATRWSRRDPATSLRWARLLKKHGADADAVLPETGKSSRQLVAAGAEAIDYPKIWSVFDEHGPTDARDSIRQ